MSGLHFFGIRQERLGRRGFLGGLALIGAGVVAACSSGGGAPSSSSDNAAATAASKVSSGMNAAANAAQSANATVVKMTDQNKYDPDTVTIAKGGTVTWQNTSSTVHTATFDPSKVANKADVSLPEGVQPFDSGLIQAGQSWSHTFTEAGTYKYTCIPHEALGMHGTVIVK
jgi:plastocyanin